MLDPLSRRLIRPPERRRRAGLGRRCSMLDPRTSAGYAKRVGRWRMNPNRFNISACVQRISHIAHRTFHLTSSISSSHILTYSYTIYSAPSSSSQRNCPLLSDRNILRLENYSHPMRKYRRRALSSHSPESLFLFQAHRKLSR